MIKNNLICIEIALILILILLTAVWAGNTDFMLMFGQISVLLLITIIVIFSKNLKKMVAEMSKNPATKFFLAIVIIALFQSAPWTGLSVYPSYSLSSFKILLSCFLTFSLSAALFKERNSLLGLFISLMVFGAIESAIGLSQSFSGRNTLFGIMTLPRGWRAYGTFYNPDHFAGFLELCLFSTLGLVASVLPSRERFLRWRDRLYSLSGKERNILFLIILCAGLMLLGIIFTKSRTGIFSTFVGFVFYILCFTQSKRQSVAVRRATYLVAGMLIISAYLGLETIIERYKMAGVDLDPEYGSRGSLWRTSLIAVMEKPFTGSGIGTYRFVYMKYQPVHLQSYFTHAHNDYVEAMVEFGIAGIIVIVAGFFVYYRKILNEWRGRHNPWARGLTLGALAGLLSVAVHSAGDFVLRTYANGFLFCLMLAIAFNAVRLEKREG